MSPIDFYQIETKAPAFDDVSARYDNWETQWQESKSREQRLAVIQEWDRYVRELETWANMTDLHFQQDTARADYRKAREQLDELRPKLTRLDVDMKRRLLSAEDRAELEAHYGRHAFDLWDADVMSFDPRIEEELIQEAKLCAAYTDRLAAARLEFQGDTYNFAGLAPFHTHADRKIRYDSNWVRATWFDQHREELDDIFAQLVHLRHTMAEKLSYENYVALAYRKMKRVDYDQADVERFRDAVRQHVVPLGQQLRAQQAQRLGIQRVQFWDEGVFDAQGNPRPRGKYNWLLGQAQAMFDEMGGLGEFFQIMVECHLMDLENREHKAGGGFCTDFPSHGLPYIFANFNGTKGDVEVFTHEIGHAFQSYCSRHQPLNDYLFPTYESCEIHSMGLEFLTWPHMEKFFGDDAERFRQIHLIQSLLFLPYGVAVDHFQHLLYESPSAPAAERHRMWQEMERLYLPWRDAGDLPHLAQGGQWQLQRHIYLDPFYYIDYALALTCALQLWVRGSQDRAATMDAYVALCQRGGEAPFQDLARSANLTSPFETDCLERVVQQAKAVL